VTHGAYFLHGVAGVPRSKEDCDGASGFDAQAGSKVDLGQSIGWIEGFKAVSDIFCVVDGQFVRSNPDLGQNPELLDKECYARVWLYEVKGRPHATS
jgi:glycine cleavage system H protein